MIKVVMQEEMEGARPTRSLRPMGATESMLRPGLVGATEPVLCPPPKGAGAKKEENLQADPGLRPGIREMVRQKSKAGTNNQA